MKITIFLFFIMFILAFQSCIVYQSIPTPLNESANRGKVKVINNSGEKFKFDKIIKKDSIYYGFNQEKLKNESGIYEWVDINSELRAEGLKAIYLKDQKKSVTATIFSTVLITIPVIIGGVYIFAFAISG